MTMDSNCNILLPASGVQIDWSQPVEIQQVGAPSSRSDVWRLRDSAAGITATGESYLEARRQLTLARGVHDHVEQVARREVRRELSRQLVRQSGRRRVR